MPVKTYYPQRIRPLLLALSLLASVAACAQAPASPVDVGRAVYQERCASCHGPDQEGTDKGPALADVASADIRRAVTQGIDQDPAYPEMVALPLTSGQLDAVVAFLTSENPG